jgi:hypothetical protein
MAPPSSPFGPAPLQVSGSLFSARVVECDQSVGPMPTPAITLGVELRKGLDASREGSSRTSTFAFAPVAGVFPRVILTLCQEPFGDEVLDCRCEPHR